MLESEHLILYFVSINIKSELIYLRTNFKDHIMLENNIYYILKPHLIT